MSFGLIKNLTNEVDQMLYLIGVSNFLALDNIAVLTMREVEVI